MSIKDLFSKSIKSYESSSVDVESTRFADNVAKEREVFLPPIDFSTASNFVKYGLAELYYSKSIERIYDEYPYDGSEKEKLDFHLSSSYLDRWMFEKKYPKTTGFVVLGLSSPPGAKTARGYGKTYASQEFIDIAGGLHLSSDFSTSDPLSKAFGLNATYDAAKNREKTFKLDFDAGVTFEFYLQKTAFHSNSDKEVILDLWNGEVSSSAEYGRLTIELDDNGGSDSDLILTVQSGAVGPGGATQPPAIGVFQETIATGLSLSTFNHYAITIKNVGSNLVQNFYVNGQRTRTGNLGSTTVKEIKGLVKGRIGALQTAPSSSLGTGTEVSGDGKLSGSLDEFRFWKTQRSGRQIGLNYFKNVGGGSNTDDNTTSLGLYFKFNEGITGNTTTDSVVLDYSGRIANGAWTGYAARGRDTGSAFSTTETADPIIYSSHPSVAALVSEMQTSGSNYDKEYAGSLYDSMPQWMRDEDDNENLKNINQIFASYLDTLHAQITAIPDLRAKRYVEQGSDGNYKAIPFMKNVLEDKGFMTRDVFINSDVFEALTSYDENTNKFNKNVDEIKNLIYTNIYNNLEGIYKSKGTERSVRNLIRCFGVDDELLKLNVYTDGGTHYFTDKSKSTSVKKKYINFNSPEYFSSTIYQTASLFNTNTFITGSNRHLREVNNAFTVELDMIVPHKKNQADKGFFTTPFLSSSLFGFHEAADNVHSYNWVTPETASIQVYLVREEQDSRNAKFVMKSRDKSINLSSDFIPNIYDNNHWNVAVRVKPLTYPYAGNVTNTKPNYSVELYAVNHNMDELVHEVNLSTNINFTSGSAFLSKPKRIFVGAHLENFRGTVQERSDIMVGGCRAWLDYIDNSAIKQHNKDVSNFGEQESYRSSNMFTLENKHIPSYDLNILNWDFDTVTGSNSSGDFIVDDITSGSTDTIYGWPDTIIRREHRGRGKGFGASKTSFIENEFVFALKKELPEVSYTNENVFVKGDREINFIKDDDVSDNFFLLEKSMNAIVSEEMLRTFSTIQEFANLIGRPEDRYRQNYKRLDKVRELFFNRVTSDIDFETFINYYKWIDSAIGDMISQLYPASVRFGEAASNVVESHILERNKLQNRIGLLDRYESTEGSIRGINELTYNWQFGHAPNYETYAYQNNKSLLMAQDANDKAIANLDSGADKFCLAFWTKADCSVSTSGQITLRKAANEVFRIDYRNSSTAFRIRLKATGSGGDGGQNLATFTGTTIADDTWAHLVFKVEDSVSDIIHTASAMTTANLKLFINGTEAVISDPATDNTNTSAFLIEGAVDRIELASNNSYDTEFDEITFFTGSLTNDQITELYNGGKYFDPTSDSFSKNNAVVAHWRMGDTSGDTNALINDVVGAQNFVISPNSSVSITSDVFDQGQFVKNRDNVHCLWQREREEREDIPDRETIRQIIVNDTNQTSSNLAQLDKTIYQGSTYARRRLSRPYAISIGFNNSIHGGINYSSQKNRNFVREVTNPHGGEFASGAPKNVFGIGLGDGQGINEKQKCDDVLKPNLLQKLNAECVVGKSADELGTRPLSPLAESEFRLKSEHYWPFNIISGSIKSGYNAKVDSLFRNNTIFANIHADTIDITNEIPMQGPFTNQHVGGHQARHVDINRHDTTLVTEGGGATTNNLDDQYSRPEAWRLLIGEHQTVTNRDGAAGFVGPDYGGPYPNITRQHAIYFREEKAKRPLNVRNIQTTTASATVGNYFHSYEFLNSFGNNKRHFVKSSGFPLPAAISTLPMSNVVLNPINNQDAIVTAHEPFIEGGVQRYGFQVPEATITASQNIITTRFSAPGGPQTSTRGYLDITTGERSVYNSINFRNLPVRGSGSGEPNRNYQSPGPLVTVPARISVSDQLGKRRGLRTLLNNHSGKFGSDPTFGSIASTTYVTQPAFHKQHRNNLERVEAIGSRRGLLFNSSTISTAKTVDVINTTSATTGIAVSFWAKVFTLKDGGSGTRDTVNTDEYRYLVVGEKSNGEASQFFIYLDSSAAPAQDLVVKFEDSAVSNKMTTKKYNFLPFMDQVVNIIATCEETSGTITLYINGVAQTATSDTPGAGGDVVNPDITLRLGVGSGKQVFDGVRSFADAIISDVAIFNRKLSAGNVDALYPEDIGGSVASVSFANALNVFFQLGEELFLSDGLEFGDNLAPIVLIPSTHGVGTAGTVLQTTGPLLHVGNGPGPLVQPLRPIDSLTRNQFNNTALITSPIPASDFQYSWINNAISGSNWRLGQKVYGYAPRDGILSSSAGFTEAIVFPSASSLFGE